MRTVIFDLDGTLADTSGDLIEAANACFRALGVGDLLRHGQDAGVALRGGRAMLRLGFARLGRPVDPAEIDLWYPRLLAAYEGALDRYTTLFPGVEQALECLRADRFRLGVCTNKPEVLAHKLLQSLGIRDMFGSLIGADTLPVRKPDPAPYVMSVTRAGGSLRRSFLIGDSVTDRDTARAAGVPCVLVTFGPSGEDMAALAPEALLEDFADLPKMAAGLLGAADAAE